MKVICPTSGIKYTITTPIRGHAISQHPMLSASIKVAQLNEWYLDDWIKGDLQPVETHLLGVAYLQRLPLESIHIQPIDETKLEKWDAFWSGNLERLARLAAKLENKDSMYRRLPKFVVSGDTMRFLPDWLDSLESEMGYNSQPVSEKAKELNRSSYKFIADNSSQAIKLLEPDEIDGIVLRALRNSPLSGNESKALPVIVSDWARKVTEFPENCKMKYQRIIMTIFDPDAINKVLMSDIKLHEVVALQDHLMLNTPPHAVGTSHSQILMAKLENFIPVFADFSPMISARKKVNEDSLVAALDGSDAPVRTNYNLPKSTGPSLAEKLAARLAAIANKGK